MVGILDNKKVAELVVEQDENKEYLKINPETLATIVEDVTNSQNGVDKTVQEHIDDKSIHLTRVDVQQLTRRMVEVDNIIAGQNITITKDENSNDITISSKDFNNLGYITADDIIPDDDTISLSKKDDKKLGIKANIPDVSKMVKQRNIKSGDTGINIEYDDDSNDVYIYGEGNQFKAGDGIEITNGTLINTKPDKNVILNAGRNITINGEYPEFTISGSDVVRINNWHSNVHYSLDDMVIYENALMVCIEDHTSENAFEADKWKLLSGFQANRQYFYIENETTTDITLNSVIPSKEVVVINISGIVQQALNYDLQPDGQTIRFIQPLPKDSIVEVIVVSNVVMDTYDQDVNIQPWKGNTAYAKDNIVLYNNNIYICLARHISSGEFDKTKWQMICGYLKKSYSFNSTNALTEVTLPTYVHSKDLVEVNVNHSMLQSSEYNVDSTGYKIKFTSSIAANTPIEISVYNSGVVQLPEIPEINNQAKYFLTTDENGKKYVLKSINEVMEILNLETLLDYANHPNSIITVNTHGTGYRYMEFSELGGQLKSGQVKSGLTMSSIQKGYLRIQPGSALSHNQDTLITLSSMIQKDATSEWSQGYGRGSAIGTSLDEWIQPTMISNLYNGYQIFTSDYITDREGWRAMDGKKNKGNGWQVNAKNAIFRLECPSEIVLQGFDFYNTMTGTVNHSKEIEVWINDETNVVATFTAKNENYGYTHIDIKNTVASRTVGFTIKSSYGQTVGAQEIKFIAKGQTFMAKNQTYYVYLLGNDNGSSYDFATSLYNADDFSNHLPTVYTKYALIGSFYSDNNYNITNIYPQKPLNQELIEGCLNATINKNIIETRIYDAKSDKPITLVEQFGTSMIADNRVNFPQAFSKLLYVMANGEKITASDVKGFNTTSSSGSISWVAKGYK